MSLAGGAHLGPYEIVGALGSGGMGEVYRARDTRLDRQVAIKTLPQHLAERADLRERFEREARAVSSLNHPHICTLYDIGQQDGIEFIVMELLEGETLASRLLQGPLPINEVLRYSFEVADALDKAHRHGVVHRDLKPGNLMLTKSGSKLLDFGLAKVTQATGFRPISDGRDSKSGSGSHADNLTAQGAMLGTLHYMAPEQLEGREADPRSDIFSLGVLIYEMVTGRRAFQGKSQASVVAAILDRDPAPISSVQSNTPSALDRVVRRCLAKDPDDRWQSAGDLANELKWIAEDEPTAIVPAAVDSKSIMPAAPAVKRRDVLPWVLAAGLLAATIYFAVPYFNRVPAPSAGLMRFLVTTQPTSAPGHIAVSPDGRHIAYIGRTTEGPQGIWLRPLNDVSARYLAGTENALHQFWSPDSRFIGFFASGKLKKVDVAGGSIQTITDASGGVGGTWNREGVIVFTDGTVLRRVSSNGGSSTTISTLDASANEQAHLAPFFLPDGNHLIYLRRNAEASRSGIFARALDSEESTRILDGDNVATYASPGYIFTLQDDTLVARPFDAQRIEVNGDAVTLAQRIQGNTLNNRSGFSFSNNGVLAHRNLANSNSSMTWFSRSGQRVNSVGPPALYGEWALSPDGKTLVVEKTESPVSSDLWLLDSVQGSGTRFTFGENIEGSPLWSTDGLHVRFSVGSPGKGYDIYQKLKSAAGDEEPLVKSDTGTFAIPEDQSAAYLVYRTVDAKGNADLWILPLTGDRKPIPYLQAPLNQTDAQVSPDGKWLAYASNETGKYEIYAQSFPVPGAKRQISTAGGHMPRWRSDGKELFYVSLDNKMTAVDFSDRTQFGSPQPLFDIRLARRGVPASTGRSQYAVSPDGQRFLINTAVENVDVPITVIINWLDGLRP